MLVVLNFDVLYCCTKDLRQNRVNNGKGVHVGNYFFNQVSFTY